MTLRRIAPVSWTPEAAEDLERIQAYYLEASADMGTADAVILQLMDACEALGRFPGQGRPGRVPGTRELIPPDLPYVIVYQADPGRVIVLRTLHQRRRWPE